MFSDSKFAKRFHCNITKITCILNKTPDFKGCDVMKVLPYWLLNDGIDNNNFKKMSGTESSKTVDFHFSWHVHKKGEHCCTGETMFNGLNQVLKKKTEDYEGKFHISASKTLTLMSTSITWSNQEARRGSNQFLFAECASHLAHIAAGQVENAFACISGFDTGEKQVDICYYLKRSTRRRRTLIEYVGFVGEDWDDIIRFVSKRWLTLEICWKKEQEKYEGLNSMFQRWSNVSNK